MIKSLRSGVLIIGSLLWDNDIRESWRESHLVINEKIYVKTPIGFGRRSQSRGNTFTMTFRDDGRLGQAVLVPCATLIEGVEGLSREAEALWQAEQRSATEGCIGSSWGCVGVLVRDENLFNDMSVWRNYFHQKMQGLSISPVDEDGRLHIPWPVTTALNTPVDLDIILAVATVANGNFDFCEIADAWINQNEGHEHYFFENVRHGIRTPEDIHIWQRIQQKAPPWLGKSEFTDVVKMLESEATQMALGQNRL